MIFIPTLISVFDSWQETSPLSHVGKAAVHQSFIPCSALHTLFGAVPLPSHRAQESAAGGAWRPSHLGARLPSTCRITNRGATSFALERSDFSTASGKIYERTELPLVLPSCPGNLCMHANSWALWHNQRYLCICIYRCIDTCLA